MLMKKVRIEQGSLIAYIEHSDVELLVDTKEVVPKTFWEEDSMKNGDCDQDGYYRISNLSNVNYIKSSPFIPNVDYLSKLSRQEVARMAREAASNHRDLVEILGKLYSRISLEDHEVKALEDNVALRDDVASELQKKAFVTDDFSQEARFLAVEEAVIRQSKHYEESLSEYLKTLAPKSKDDEPKKLTKKRRSLRSLFKLDK